MFDPTPSCFGKLSRFPWTSLQGRGVPSQEPQLTWGLNSCFVRTWFRLQGFLMTHAPKMKESSPCSRFKLRGSSLGSAIWMYSWLIRPGELTHLWFLKDHSEVTWRALKEHQYDFKKSPWDRRETAHRSGELRQERSRSGECGFKFYRCLQQPEPEPPSTQLLRTHRPEPILESQRETILES